MRFGFLWIISNGGLERRLPDELKPDHTTQGLLDVINRSSPRQIGKAMEQLRKEQLKSKKSQPLQDQQVRTRERRNRIVANEQGGK